ncbi:inorganic phosphate transporter, partial [Lineolata rhizophorae]
LPQTRDQKRRHIVGTLDANGFNWLVWAVASSGFFTDSYNLFATNVVLPALAYVYWHEENSGGGNERIINVLTLTGSILGQLLFGFLADKYGRTRLYGIELVIVICSTIGVATSSNGFEGTMSIIAAISCYRFFMGVGIGAEYPLSAVITAEWAPTQSRVRMMASVFIFQPIGQVMAQLVSVWVLLALNNKYDFADSTNVAYCKRIIDIHWRWVAGVGAIPALIAIVFRWMITDPGRFTLDVQDQGKQALHDTHSLYPFPAGSEEEGHELQPSPAMTAMTDEMSSVRHANQEDPLPKQFSRQDIRQYFITEGNWRYLAGTSLCWFLLDVAFYGLGINNPRTIAKLWTTHRTEYQDEDVPIWVSDPTSMRRPDDFPPIYRVLMTNAKQSILTIGIGALVGSAIFIKIAPYTPRKTFLVWSFLGLGVLLAITGGTFFRAFQTDLHALSIVFYALCQLFFNLGPNTLTFIIPAEIFPTRYRCTCHGISAASGKLGSVVVQAVLPRITIGGGAAFRAANSDALGWVLVIFAFVMASGAAFAWAWIPELQRPRPLPSKTLEELAEGVRGAEMRGEVVGFRKKVRRLWWVART